MNATNVINGTFGSVWVNGELWLDIESVEATVTQEYEDVNMSCDSATYKKANGWTGEGTLTVKKVYTRGGKLIGESVKKGKTAEFTITTKLADPDSLGRERVSIEGVTFNSFSLVNFEQKTNASEELPFNFTDYEYIDSI